jgi:20S proteasome alpha/beta subunit
LTSLSDQIKRINQEGDSEKLRLFAGYFDGQNRPEIVIFNRDGEIKQINGYVCLGSGVDRVYADLEKNYNPDWTTKQAVENAIDLIYLASDVPTVNFLPMICVLTKEGVLDLSDKTVSLFTISRLP